VITRKNPSEVIPDFDFENHGSLGLLRPLTNAARAWVTANVSQEGFQPCWPTIVVEARYVDAILNGIVGDGLVMR
jgi:hypothetical protein